MGRGEDKGQPSLRVNGPGGAHAARRHHQGRPERPGMFYFGGTFVGRTFVGGVFGRHLEFVGGVEGGEDKVVAGGAFEDGPERPGLRGLSRIITENTKGYLGLLQ